MDLSLKNPEINFNSQSEAPLVYEFGEFQLQVGPRLLLRNGEELPLTPKAVSTLCVLVAQSEQIVSKDELMQSLWPDAVVEESNLAQYLHFLRKTLGNMPDGRPYIETLKRRGYRFNAKVRSGSIHARNGHGETAQTDILAPAPPRSRLAGSFLVGIPVVVAILLVGWFVAKRTGWLTGGEVQKPAADVIVAPLTSGENVTQTTISHDGKYFVYSDHDGDRSRLVLQAVDQSSRSEILSRFEGRIENLSFTPDDKQIFFTATSASKENNGLYRVAANGGSPSKIFDTITSPVSFSADGSKMVFVRLNPNGNGREQIVQTSLDGSGEIVLVDARNDERLSPNAALSHSGQFVVYGSITRKFPIVCSLTKFDLTDRSIIPLTNEQWDSCYRIAFTHDDTGIAFVGTRHNEAFTTRRDQVYYLELGQAESRRLTADGNWHDPTSLGMTDAGEIIALPLARISQLWTIDSDGSPGTAEQITQGQADGRNGIVSTPDGKVDFLARDGDGYAVFETNSDGSDRRRIIGSPTMQELRSDADAGFLVYAEQQNDLTQLFRTDRNGGNRQQLTFGNSSKIDSTVSPDGKWLIFVDDGGSDTFSLQRIPAEGGTPKILAKGSCGVPHYSHDGQFIACFADGKIRILSAETGELTSELTPEASVISNSGARWSPDDKYLVYRVVKNGATNLWRQPVAGGTAEQLTRFPKGDLYNFCYAWDGRTIYLSRGAQIRNAILIKGFR